MTPEEIQNRLTEIRSRLEELDREFQGQALPEAEKAEFEGLVNERAELDRLSAELEARQQVITAGAAEPQRQEAGFNVAPQRASGEDIYDFSTIRSQFDAPEIAVRELRDRALTAVEQGDYPYESEKAEDVRSNVEQLVRSVDTEDGVLARRILATGSPVYKRAFGKAVMNRPLSAEEQRALSLTTTAGGFAVPFTLDPTVIHTSNHSVNPFRAISRNVTIVTDEWNGVSSAGVTAAYAAEATEASDNAPTLAQPSISVEKAQVFVPFSIEIGQDWSGLQQEMTRMFQESKDDLEATKFGFGAGSGSDEPQGVLVGGTITYTTAATATLAVADIYGTETQLPPRHRPGASWVANRGIYNTIRQFDTSGGASLWVDNLRGGLENQVPTPGRTAQDLLGYPTYELSSMAGTVGSAGTLAVFGDFSRYVIVDRAGMNVELIPHLFATGANRPSGQRGIYAWWRNSAEVVDVGAFRKVLAL